MSVAVSRPDPLLGGFYTVSEAARLLRIENKQRIYRWLGRDNAVLARDYDPADIGGSQELSFWDLFEVRFVETFRGQGLSLQYLRKVATKARAEFRSKHPFALSTARYMTDRKNIFERRVPTAALYRTFKAQGRVERVASWYGIEVEEAREALEFEVRLAS